MPNLTLDVLLHHSPLEDGQWLSRALFWPEVSSLGDSPEAGAQQILRLLGKLGPTLAGEQIFRRQISGEPKRLTLELELAPGKAVAGWQTPLPLRFDTLQWAHDAHSWLAWVPELDVEIYARTAEKLAQRLEDHVKQALLRQQPKPVLKQVLMRQRAGEGQIQRLSLSFKLPSPKQAMLAQAQSAADEERQLIQECGRDISKQALPEAFGLEQPLEQLAGLLKGKQARSVLIVGPSGVGKTALQYQLIHKRQGYGLLTRQVWETSGSRLIAGMTGFGMWQERCQRLMRLAAKEQALLLLGNLYELSEVGKSPHSQLGIAGFLRPTLARGEVLAIAECTPEQLVLLEAADPQLIAAFMRFDLAEPEPAHGRRILAEAAQAFARQQGVTLSEAALAASDRLHRRYGAYSVYPGRPLRFLKALIGETEKGATLEPTAVQRRFGIETGLPAFLLDPAAGFAPAAAREWFAARVQGQPQAIGPVIDLLAMMRTQLTQRRKPLASLMLIGPTGTGKTELAKTLAEFLFGDRSRLLRLDMSEYGDALAASRLIGGPLGAEGLLTARVREQPFSVILLDEFEKADAACFDLLLQVLGEGRLTDGRGQTADFTNSVIIMTSNLGAAGFARPEPGFTQASGKADASSHFAKAVAGFLRPEMLNRIDAILAFEPLQRETLRRLARREWRKALERDGLQQRQIDCALSDEALDALAAAGWDPRYGARPLKRTLEREALLPLAAALNRYPASQPLTARIELAEPAPGSPVGLSASLMVEVRGVETPSGDRALGLEVARVSDLRRQLQRLRRHERLNDLETLDLRIRQLQRQIELRPKLELMPDQLRELQLAPSVSETLNRLRALGSSCEALELSAWERSFGLRDAEAFGSAEIVLGMRPLLQERDWIGKQLYRLSFDEPDTLALALISPDASWLAELAGAYLQLARERGDSCALSFYRRPSETSKAGWDAQADLDQALADLDAQTLALVLELRGIGARAYYHQEVGLHARQELREPESDSWPERVVVEILSGPLKHYSPLPGGQLQEWAKQQTERRIWLMRDRAFHDTVLGVTFGSGRQSLAQGLQDALDKLLMVEIREILDAEDAAEPSP